MKLGILATFLLGLLLGTTAAATPQDAPPSDGGWNFADEDEATSTWTQDLKDQAPDLLIFGAFVTLTMVGFFRKSEPLKWITMAVAIIYLGFARSQLITITNIFALTTWSLPVFRHNLAWYAFALFTVISTILWGRLYCGRVCAFGSLTQLMDKIVPARLRVDLPRSIEQRAAYIKYGLLGGTLLYYLLTRDISIYRYVEPFWMFSLRATTALWFGLGILLLATIFIRNLYCRFLCPVGAFLGLLSNLTVFRIKRWSECKTCTLCEKKCEWGAIRGPVIVASECVRCDDCERLYMDQKKCPHWLILKKKAQTAASHS